jgi:hypothetical protein
MPVQDLRLFSLAPAPASASSTVFADPEWRGALGDGADERRLRPLCEIRAQIARLAGWIAAGGDYGWLGAYQSRRAAFELQSVRAQIAHEKSGLSEEPLERFERQAIQSRLDRLEACLEAARAGVGLG